MSCHEYDNAIERLLADEIGDGERDRLLAHTQDCSACREFVDLHYRLAEPDLAVDLPDDVEFAAMRQAVLRRIRAERAESAAPTSTRFGLGEFFRALIAQPALAGGLAAVMLAMLAVGFVAGRDRDGGGESLQPGGDPIVAQMVREASRNRGLADVENSPFLYSNVRLGETARGEVALSFDVTRHVELTRTTDDPLVKEVLAQSLVNSEPVGTRLEAIGRAGTLTDPKIEQALIYALLNDDNLAVRMRALSILRGYPRNSQIEEAFIMVLSGEENVQLRIQALDWLAAGDLTRQRFDDVMRNAQVQDPAFQIQAARYADRLN